MVLLFYMPKRSDTDRAAQGLRLVSYCPVCEVRSKSMLARTLGTKGETKLMHIKCHKCQNAFLALVLVNQVGASSIGLLTDLGYEDVLRFGSQQNISVNDVIAVHEQLTKGLFRVSVEYSGKKTTKTAVKNTKKSKKSIGDIKG